MAKKSGMCGIKKPARQNPAKPGSPFRKSSTGLGRVKPAKAGKQRSRMTNP